MPDEIENHTLRILKEMREEIHKRFDKIETDMSAFRNETNERLDRIESVFSGLAYLQADQRGQIEAMESRLNRIEDQLGLTNMPAE